MRSRSTELGKGRRRRHLLIRKALVIAAPQRLVDEDGSALFDSIVRPVAPVTVVLVDRKLSGGWFERADNAFALLSGQKPTFALIGVPKPAAEHLREISSTLQISLPLSPYAVR